MSITFRRDPLGDMPDFSKHWAEQAQRRYDDMISEAIKARCMEYGYEWALERISMVLDHKNNQLFYYKTDIGTLEPLIALSPMDVSWKQGGPLENITVTMGAIELSMDIFKPTPINHTNQVYDTRYLT